MNKELWIGVVVLVVVWLFWRRRSAKAAMFVPGQFNNIWPGQRVVNQRNYGAPGWRGRGTRNNGGRVGGRFYPGTQGAYVAI